MNCLCFQHTTKEKPQKPDFSDNLNIYKLRQFQKLVKV